MFIRVESPVGTCDVDKLFHPQNPACENWQRSGLVEIHSEYRPGKIAQFFNKLVGKQ
jgi:hypothetical protein